MTALDILQKIQNTYGNHMTKNAHKPLFVFELPLKTSHHDERILQIRLNAARQIYNAVLGECLKRYGKLHRYLERTNEDYRTINEKITAALEGVETKSQRIAIQKTLIPQYKARKKIIVAHLVRFHLYYHLEDKDISECAQVYGEQQCNKTNPLLSSCLALTRKISQVNDKKKTTLYKQLIRKRNQIVQRINLDQGIYNFGYALPKKSKWIEDHLDSAVIRHEVKSAWMIFSRYLWGQIGRPKFSGYHHFRSVEHDNSGPNGITQSIRLVEKDQQFYVCWASGRGTRNDGKNFKDEALQIPVLLDKKDRHGYQKHALGLTHKAIRILYRDVKSKRRWYVQCTVEGVPLNVHDIGHGAIVGLDFGIETIAWYSGEYSHKEIFCEELDIQDIKIKDIQRRMDASRRSSNPDNYNEDGTCKKGRLKWNYTKHYQNLRKQKAELDRRMAATRKTLHGKKINAILESGNIIRTEKIDYRQWQKDYGKTMRHRAPGMFHSRLKQKTFVSGGRFEEIDTYSTRLSQTCHGCGKQVKKDLNNRIHHCDCGIGPVDRDKYSAFLAAHVEDGKLNVSSASKNWPSAEPHLGIYNCPEKERSDNGQEKSKELKSDIEAVSL